MNPVELRLLALYQRLWRENCVLLGLLRGGYALAQAEKILARSATARPAGAQRAVVLRARRVVA